MRRPTVPLVASLALLAGTARADIPTIDAAQLTRHAQTASDTVKLVPVTLGRKDANSGVKCAVTTGQKAAVVDPTAAPQPGAATAAVKAYAPEAPANPDPDARGGALGAQTLAQSTGGVAAGLDASRTTLKSASSTFQSLGRTVGTAPTVMAALDANSGARLQSTLAWNGAIGSANLWLTALNALNLARTSDASRAALAMRATANTVDVVAAPQCPAGTFGAGTAADPCRPVTGVCSGTGAACAPRRLLGGDGAVLLVLLPGAAAAPASRPPAITLADLAAALAALPAQAP